MGGILYLHGYASGSESTKGQYLAARFEETGVNVTLPDLDDGDFTGTTVSRQLRLVGKLARELRPTMLIGSSLGGYVAALHAAREPDTAPPLVLLAPAFDFATDLRNLLGPDEARWREQGTMAVFHHRHKRKMPLSYGFLEDALRYEAYPDVRVPTKILQGLLDVVVNPGHSYLFARGRPNVEVEYLETDHSMLSAIELIWVSAWDFYRTQTKRGS